MRDSVSFGSDNHSGVHPAALDAIGLANQGHQPAYGNDSVTEEARQLFRAHFGETAEPFFVFTGTAANTLAIRAMCRSFESVVATKMAHINEDECGAPEFITGCKIVALPSCQGKLNAADILGLKINPNDPHRVVPRLVSITQATELGTLYSVQEIQEICEAAHHRGLLVHMDGARLANAAVFLGCELKALTTDCGVDAVSFGGTKNGLMCAEAVIFLKKGLATDFPFIRKQSMQLASKMRFVSCQFLPYLRDGLWRQNATQANGVARYLHERLGALPGCEMPYPTQANEVFARIPEPLAHYLQQRGRAYPWGDGLTRFVCSFDMTKEHVDLLVDPLESEESPA